MAEITLQQLYRCIGIITYTFYSKVKNKCIVDVVLVHKYTVLCAMGGLGGNKTDETVGGGKEAEKKCGNKIGNSTKIIIIIITTSNNNSNTEQGSHQHGHRPPPPASPTEQEQAHDEHTFITKRTLLFLTIKFPASLAPANFNSCYAFRLNSPSFRPPSIGMRIGGDIIMYNMIKQSVPLILYIIKWIRLMR